MFSIFDDIIGGAVEVRGGASIKTYHNNRGDVKKDEVLQKLIPAEIGECALYLGRAPGESCLTKEMVHDITGLLGVADIPAAKEKLRCETEKCVVDRLKGELGGEVDVFKIRGPTDSTLLNNFNIDGTLQQWAARWREFYPYNFNMVNYAEYSFDPHAGAVNRPDSLATIQFGDLYSGRFGRPYRCCACVINSDKYQGGGKHWMALFADARPDPKGGAGPAVWSVEFFNSSGNSPVPEWINWLLKTREQMERILGQDIGGQAMATERSQTPRVEIVKVCRIRHQQSRSECGAYSLFYIWARLNGVPYTYFMENPIPDQLMFEFRQHLFDGARKTISGRFSFDKFKRAVRIEWEKD